MTGGARYTRPQSPQTEVDGAPSHRDPSGEQGRRGVLRSRLRRLGHDTPRRAARRTPDRPVLVQHGDWPLARAADEARLCGSWLLRVRLRISHPLGISRHSVEGMCAARVGAGGVRRVRRHSQWDPTARRRDVKQPSLTPGRSGPDRLSCLRVRRSSSQPCDRCATA